jgi:hypothetical protein
MNPTLKPLSQALTVQSLIDQLKHYDPSLPIVVQSYEDGYDPLTHLRVLAIEPTTPHPAWYNGIYQENPQASQSALVLSSSLSREEKP